MKILQLSDLDLNGTYTYAEYAKWRFDEYVELIKGKVYKMSPAPRRVHQKLASKIFKKLSRYLDKCAPCEVYFAPFDVRLPQYDANGELKTDIYTVVQPDICVICDPAKLDDAGCLGAPDLVVEILSPSTAKKDLNEKFKIYEESGVREYWIVFPENHVLHIYSLQNDQYELAAQYEKDGTANSIIFPDLELDIFELFN
jgi:Uma2 family endonuclease